MDSHTFHFSICMSACLSFFFLYGNPLKRNIYTYICIWITICYSCVILLLSMENGIFLYIFRNREWEREKKKTDVTKVYVHTYIYFNGIYHTFPPHSYRVWCPHFITGHSFPHPLPLTLPMNPTMTPTCPGSFPLPGLRFWYRGRVAARPSRLHYGIKNKFWPTFQEGNLRQMGLGTFIARLERRAWRRWMVRRLGRVGRLGRVVEVVIQPPLPLSFLFFSLFLSFWRAFYLSIQFYLPSFSILPSFPILSYPSFLSYPFWCRSCAQPTLPGTFPFASLRVVCQRGSCPTLPSGLRVTAFLFGAHRQPPVKWASPEGFLEAKDTTTTTTTTTTALARPSLQTPPHPIGLHHPPAHTGGG